MPAEFNSDLAIVVPICLGDKVIQSMVIIRYYGETILVGWLMSRCQPYPMRDGKLLQAV
jgi:hypothetical protein